MSGRLLIMAAGTGGHVMPGLAVAQEMRARGWTVSWLGTERGMENRLVPQAGIELDRIDFHGLRGKGVAGNLKGGLSMIKALAQCRAVWKKRQPDVVLGMGGYVCFPGGMVNAMSRKPLMLVNADAALLLSNKTLLPFTRRIAFGFDCEDARRLGADKAVVTGNPVRREIAALAEPLARFDAHAGPVRVLVVGGSLGAKVLNDTVPEALARLPVASRPQVVHQTGLAHIDAVREHYARLGVQADIRPFIDDMATALADCDVVLCRAGAITVSELCAAGVASILVPLVVSTTSHQRDNAQWMASHGAAIHLPQTELDAESLAQRLQALGRIELQAMAIQARTLGRSGATARVADELEALAAGSASADTPTTTEAPTA
ncbi:undecaprenyldiphospho-muramoylpentapeptide beta-N-acetylglucosaminyltransferase [Amphibiibacter pelophylacis]|uniref:Undecaprenyldiphospho-muramoylpentapeptide beta-N-acetylglucosaminyltransferase n=1 Tax=Amphibiibacter pelophylacis TaxID=1799477 RepID=A0ACC6P5I2_9BURK